MLEPSTTSVEQGQRFTSTDGEDERHSKRVSAAYSSLAPTLATVPTAMSIHASAEPADDAPVNEFELLISAVERLSSRSSQFEQQRYQTAQRATGGNPDSFVQAPVTRSRPGLASSSKPSTSTNASGRSSKSQDIAEKRQLERDVQRGNTFSYDDQRVAYAAPVRNKVADERRSVEQTDKDWSALNVGIAVQTEMSSVSLPIEKNGESSNHHEGDPDRAASLGKAPGSKRRSFILSNKRDTRRHSALLDDLQVDRDSEMNKKHLSMTHVEIWQRLREKIGAAERDEGFGAEDDRLGPNSLEVLLANENERRLSYMAHSDLIRPRSDPFPYLIQVLENISCILLTIQGGRGDLNFELDASTTETQLVVVTEPDSTMLAKIELPVHVSSEQHPKVTIGSDNLEVRIAMARTAEAKKEGVSDEIMPYSAIELNALRPFAIACDSCGSMLTGPSQIKQCRPMPSEGWSELLDSWMCHGGAGGLSDSVARAAARASSEGNVGLAAPTGCLLVSNTYYQLNSADVVEHSVILVDQHYPRCSSCYGILANHGDMSDLRQFNFYKHAVSIVTHSSKIATKYPAVVHLSARLLEKGHAQATFRFIIEGNERKGRSVLLWVFQPDVQIFVSPPKDWQAQSHDFAEEWLRVDLTQRIRTPIRAMKILFVTSTAHSSAPATNSADSSLERLTYPDDYVQRLCTYLDATNLWQPESQRRMNDMQVGWLERM